MSCFDCRFRLARRSAILRVFVLLCASNFLNPALVGQTYTAAQYLKGRTAPNFYSQHTLPRLTRWGWTLSYDATVELAEHWGYALEIGGYLTNSAVEAIKNNPTSQNARLVALAKTNPERYPLSVLAYRPLISGLAQMPPELLAQYYVRDAKGNQVIDPATGGPSARTVSPIAPDAIYQWTAAEQAAPLAKLREMVPISIVLSGGEDGLTVPGHSASYWNQDPRVVSAKGPLSWHDYASQRKAHYQQIISDATYQAVPDRDLFVYYHTDGATHRGAISNWENWFFNYEDTQTGSDVANSSLYYKYNNTGWTGSSDLLSLALNSVSQQIAAGDKLSYSWLNGGVDRTGLSDTTRYMGFLKSLYNAGMIGGVASYYSYPAGGFTSDLSGAPPSWLTQIEALGQVHAAYSYLEEYLRDGHLLPGPLKHKWSADLPAYELPTGDLNARVLARKLDDQREWLITAWAAEGQGRTVTASVPEFGNVQLLARPEGSIYLLSDTASGRKLRLLDIDGMLPSANLNMVTVTSGEGDLYQSLENHVLLDGENFSVDFVPQPGSQIINAYLDGVPLGPTARVSLSNIVENHTVFFQTMSNQLLQAVTDGDVNRDGRVDGRDYLEWQRAFATAAPHADLDGDQRVGLSDLAQWKSAYDSQAFPVFAAGAGAARNADGLAFLRWQQAFGTTSPSGDFNGSGRADYQDLNSWQSFYGAQVSGNLVALAVPEPRGILVWVFPGVLFVLQHDRSRNTISALSTHL